MLSSYLKALNFIVCKKESSITTQSKAEFNCLKLSCLDNVRLNFKYMLTRYNHMYITILHSICVVIK